MGNINIDKDHVTNFDFKKIKFCSRQFAQPEVHDYVYSTVYEYTVGLSKNVQITAEGHFVRCEYNLQIRYIYELNCLSIVLALDYLISCMYVGSN